MDWKLAQTFENGNVKIPDQWLHLYYYEALNILFRFENALRIFVYVILKREFGETWDTAAISDGSTIRTETKKRITQANEHGYLGYEVLSPMLYLNSGELAQILTSDAYWKHFARYFRASKSIVLTKLQEIGTVRNSLAHFRPIKNDDVDLVKQNSRHILLEVENCLTEVNATLNVVPTNSTDLWYTEIKAIGNEFISTGLFASKDHEWVRVALTYPIPTLQSRAYGETFASFNVGNFRTAELVERFAAIRDNCIHVTELPVYGSLDSEMNIRADKTINIVFPISRLQANLVAIVEEFKAIARTVEAESNLTAQDNLARGELIEVATASADVREGHNKQKYWAVDLDSVLTPATAVQRVEYWGQRSIYTTDFIAATSHYPWMPATVSKPSWF